MTDATYPIASVATDETKTQNARRLTEATVVPLPVRRASAPSGAPGSSSAGVSCEASRADGERALPRVSA